MYVVPPNVPKPREMVCGPWPKSAVIPTVAWPPLVKALPVSDPVAPETEPIVPTGAPEFPFGPNVTFTLPSGVAPADCATDRFHVSEELWLQVSSISCDVPNES